MGSKEAFHTSGMENEVKYARIFLAYSLYAGPSEREDVEQLQGLLAGLSFWSGLASMVLMAKKDIEEWLANLKSGQDDNK